MLIDRQVKNILMTEFSTETQVSIFLSCELDIFVRYLTEILESNKICKTLIIQLSKTISDPRAPKVKNCLFF